MSTFTSRKKKEGGEAVAAPAGVRDERGENVSCTIGAIRIKEVEKERVYYLQEEGEGGQYRACYENRRRGEKELRWQTPLIVHARKEGSPPQKKEKTADRTTRTPS